MRLDFFVKLMQLSTKHHNTISWYKYSMCDVSFDSN